MDVLHDYIIDHREIDWASVLTPWRRLLPPVVTVWIMNRFGDLFLVHDDGTVHMLDVGAGDVTQVASSRDEFRAKIDEGDNASQWLMIPLVDKLVAAGMTLGPGQCYTYKIPPVLKEGDYTVANTAVIPIVQHFAFYGDFHEQIKDVADGEFVKIEIKK